MNRSLLSIVLLSFGTILIMNSCEEPTNSTPEITRLTAGPVLIETYGQSTVTCTATDADGDALTYVWSVTEGRISGDGPTVTYTAPGSKGMYSITCMVTDGSGGEDSETVTLFVTGKGAGMISIPGGSFEMGDIWERGYSNELPVHTVTLSSFEISAMEITIRQYADYLTAALTDGLISVSSSVVGGPWDGGGSYEYFNLNGIASYISYSSGVFTVDSGYEDHPVAEVSWYGATAFAEYLRYRLPTEAEWEYAARGIAAGVDTKWSGTNTGIELLDYAWSDLNWHGKSEEVGTKLPNANGLYDMSGNVWEWCQDWYSSSYYSNSPEADPGGPDSGSYRVVRGGGYASHPYNLRCSYRNNFFPGTTHTFIGFRIARNN